MKYMDRVITSKLKYAMDVECIIDVGIYTNNHSMSLSLLDANTYEPIAKCTINLYEDDEPVEDNYVFMKDYSENEGMVDTLVYGKIISSTPVQTVDLGHVFVEKYKVIDEGIKEIWAWTTGKETS